jgi:hypothetical protein
VTNSFRLNLVSLLILVGAVSLWSVNLHKSPSSNPSVERSSDTPSGSVALDEWREVTASDGSFKVLLPGTSEFSTDQLGSDQEPVTVRVLSSFNGQQFSACWDKIPGRLSEGPSMEAGLRKILRGNQLLSKQEVSFAGLTGFDLNFASLKTNRKSGQERDNQGRFVAVRLLDAHDRLFRVEVSGDDLAMAQSSLGKLCNGFQIHPKKSSR